MSIDYPQTKSNHSADQLSPQHSWLKSLRVEDFAILFLVLCTLILRLAYTEADPDLWGHLRFGLDTLDARQIIRYDPFSYTAPGALWINHEWLAEVLFGFFWILGGSAGLIALKIIIWFAALLLPLGYLLSNGMKITRASILLLVCIILMLPAMGTVRPHIFTALCFSLTLFAIMQAEEGRIRWLWILPLVFAFWTNLHGGILAGISILIIWAILNFVQHPHTRKRIIPPVVLTLLATLVNPYGINLIIFLLRTATVPRPEISEWAPLPIVSFVGAFYLILVGFTLLVIYKTKKPPRISRLAILLLLIVLPLVAQRHVVLFALGVPFLAGSTIQDAWSRNSPRIQHNHKILVVIPILVGLIMLGIAITRLNRIIVKPAMNYPIDTVALIKQSQVEGNLAVHFNWGQYAIWHLEPRLKVSIDGRRETVYSEEILEKNLRLYTGVSGWQMLLDQYPTDLVLLPSYSPGVALLQQMPDWEIIYQDQASSLYTRRNSPIEAALQRALKEFKPAQPSGQFP